MDKLKNQTVRSTCRICYNSCGVLIQLENGQPISIKGDPENPMSKGRLCPKGFASLEYLNHPDRLNHPLQRKGKRGGGQWQKISWDEALESVADGLKKVKEKYGVLGTVFLRGASKGLPDDFLSRFANLFGSPNISSPAPVCFMPGVHGSRLTYGYYAYSDYDYGPQTIILWGFNPAATDVVEHEEIRNALKKGAKLIVIDPLEHGLTKTADTWVRLRPGTDLALCLGIINVIINENLFDREFVDKWVVGFKELKEHVQHYPPERVADITWVPEKIIKKVARTYATQGPGYIRWGNGVETTINSFQTCRAIAILRSIAGYLGVPGGEVKWSEPGGLRKGDPEFVCQDNIPQDTRAQRISMQDNLMPIIYYALPQSIVKSILQDDPYPVRAAYIQGGNFLTAYTNAKETYKALMKLEFIAAADFFMTPTAMLADIVLPAATYLECNSVEQPWHFPIAAVQQKVAQVGECRSDGQILNELTRKLGLTEYVWDDMLQPLNRVLNPAGITFDEFKEIGFLMGTRQYRHFDKTGFDTPSKKVELYSQNLAEWGFDPLPQYYEPPETPYSEPEMAKEYPLILTSRKSDVFRHSGGRQISSLRTERTQPLLKIHPATAAKLRIVEGDWVYISTKRGKIKQKAALTDSLDLRVVEVDYAWWFPEKKDSDLFGWLESNLNVLTDDRPPFNRELGSANMRGIFCKVEKVED
jgi:anaerobic selenocysteine-containing dehydrogenase